MDNLWNIKEYRQSGPNCPIVLVNLPLHKKVALSFFRFGVCPLCITSSVGYGVYQWAKKLLTKNDSLQPQKSELTGLTLSKPDMA